MKVAINKTFKNKPADEIQWKITKTFENVDISQVELASMINDGYTFCSQHNESRSQKNYLPSNVLAVDIDDGLRLEEVYAHEFVQHFAGIIYTTVNHSDEFHRFRIVFETENDIESATEMRAALNGLISKFGGDPSCKDACRMFYGSEGSHPEVYGNVVPNTVLKKLIDRGGEVSNKTNRKDKKGGSISATIARINFDENTLIKTKEGSLLTIDEIPKRTSVHCPIHVDNKPSAFVFENQKGVKGIFCSKCQQSFFTNSNLPPYEFDYDWEKVKIEEETYIVEKEFYDMKVKSVFRMEEKYLPTLNPESPIVLIKSPKGSGKTEWLKKIVQQGKKEGLSILLIGHRRSLIGSLANRLDLVSYYQPGWIDVENKTTKKGDFKNPTKYYAVSVDSISVLLDTEKHRYDIVIIDEVEQVLSHLISDTMNKGNIRNNTYQYFKYYINQSKQLFALDADLNYLTVNSLYNFFKEKENRQVTVVLNRYKPDDRCVDVYNDDKHLLAEMNDSLKSRERCFVCSNSKSKIDTLFKYSSEEFPGYRFISITSENSNDPDVLDFIKNIKDEILEYDAVFVSPTMGTGVDISFPDDVTHIDNVYGFFESQINTHFDIDQQLSRVRNPKRIRVWISPREFQFETNADVIKSEIQDTQKYEKKIIGITDEGEKIYEDSNDGYLELYSDVLSMQRGSKNHLKTHFIKFKESQGFIVNVIAKDDIKEAEGKEVKGKAEEQLLKEKIDNLTTAYLITEYEYHSLKKSKDKYPLKDVHRHAMRRYEIESFYREGISEKLIISDDDGKLRIQIRNYELFVSDDNELKRMDLVDSNMDKHVTDHKNRLVRKKLLQEIFRLSGLLDTEGRLIPYKEISSVDLEDSVQFIKDNSARIQRMFGFDIRGDIDTKPIQQLGVFLKMFGIKWKRKSKKKNGGKEYYYWISLPRLEYLNFMVNKRMDRDILDDWNTYRESMKQDRLFKGTYTNIVGELKLQISDPQYIENTEFDRNYESIWD